MPRIQTSENRKKGALWVPIALGGAMVAAVAGVWWWRNRTRSQPGPGPGPGPFLVPDPGGPTIT